MTTPGFIDFGEGMPDKVLPERPLALVRDGVAVNVIVVNAHTDATYLEAIAAENDHVVDVADLEQPPGIGWEYDGKAWTAPPAPDVAVDVAPVVDVNGVIAALEVATDEQRASIRGLLGL